MSTYNLAGLENSALNYHEAGFDVLHQRDQNIPHPVGHDFKHYRAIEGTDSDNTVFLGINPDLGDKAYWCAIQNMSGSEVCPIQVTTLNGDYFSKTGAIDTSIDNYINLANGDVLYGKFTDIYILKASPGGEYKLRAIRGA